MPNSPIFEQYAVEKLDYDITFDGDLEDGEIISSIQANYPSVSPAGPTVTASIIDYLNTDDGVKVWVDSPTAGVIYTIRVLVLTSSGKEPMQELKIQGIA